MTRSKQTKPTAPSSPPSPIHVVSTGGGTGKTSLAISLAHFLALKRGGSSLVIDADFLGSGIGNRWKSWRNKSWTKRHPDLTSLLLCPGDEYSKKLDKDLPVYCASDGLEPVRLSTHSERSPVVFAPSCLIDAKSAGLGNKRYVKELCRDIAQIHTLLAYDRTSGLIGHVFDGVAKRTSDILEARGSSLSAVVIDHAPGLGPLQWGAIESKAANVLVACNERSIIGDNTLSRLLYTIGASETVTFVKDQEVADRMIPWSLVGPNPDDPKQSETNLAAIANRIDRNDDRRAT